MMVNLSYYIRFLLDALADIEDKVLRDLRFRYQTPYVINTCKTIVEGPGWLEGLREKSRQECEEAYWNVAAWAPKLRTVWLYSPWTKPCIPSTRTSADRRARLCAPGGGGVDHSNSV